MSLLRTVSRVLVAAALAGAATMALAAEAADPNVTYKCPGNLYQNGLSAKEAEKQGCKRLEGAPVTVMQMAKPRPASAVPAASGGSGVARIDPAAQRARDSDARRILEDELRVEEERLAAMQKDFNNGQPDRQGDEKNYQKYLDRVNEMKASIARKQADVAALRREIQKLPPSVQ